MSELHLLQRQRMLLEEPEMNRYLDEADQPATEEIAAILSLKTSLPVLAVPMSQPQTSHRIVSPTDEEAKGTIPLDSVVGTDPEFQEKVFSGLRALNEQIEEAERRVEAARSERQSTLDSL